MLNRWCVLISLQFTWQRPDAPGRNKSDLHVFEGVGQEAAGKISAGQLTEMANTACRTCGSCAGMFTANSMNCLAEVIGLALPGNGSIPAAAWTDTKTLSWAVNPERIALVEKSADVLDNMLKKKIRPRDIVTKKSIDNAFILDLAMGGSSNTVLHTLALACEAGIDYPLERINRLAKRTPNLCKVSPSRPDIHMEDVHRVGGIAAILKAVVEDGRAPLNLDVKTCTGTLRDMVEKAPSADGDVIRIGDRAFSKKAGLPSCTEHCSAGRCGQNGRCREGHDEVYRTRVTIRRMKRSKLS